MNEDKRQPRETALSDSTIPIRLADIRRRCSDLLSDDGEIELSLEADDTPTDACNPYDSGAWKVTG